MHPLSSRVYYRSFLHPKNSCAVDFVKRLDVLNQPALSFAYIPNRKCPTFSRTSRTFQSSRVPVSLLLNLHPCRTMKLLTHNMLTSKCIKGVSEGYPLRLKVENLEVKESEFNQDFIVRLLPKIRYDAIYAAAKDSGNAEDLPETLPEDAATSEEFLRKLHHVLLEIEIMAGELVCPETGRVFPIQNGIPNMLLTSEETA